MPKIIIANNEKELPRGYVPVKRVNFLNHSPESLLSIIIKNCIENGQPLVVSNFEKLENWPTQAFSLDAMKLYHGQEAITLASDKKSKKEVLLGDYIQTIQKNYNLSSASTCTGPTTTEPMANNNKRAKQVREYKNLGNGIKKTYAKDIDCPKEYSRAIQNIIPEYLLPHGNNDLFSLLPQLFQAKNFMCYLGQDQTGTPIHRDLCGTMGHNIMTTGSPGAYAEWLIVVNKDREKLASVLDISKSERKKTGRDDVSERFDRKKSVIKSSFLESDRGWLNFSKVNKSDFSVQVVIQRPGDLVIIPSRAYHQVRNVGVSVKIAWNRVTAETLKCAFEDQLPLYRIINRPEVYKCKAIVSFTINEWYNQLLTVKNDPTKELDKVPALRYSRESFIKDSKILSDIFLKEIIAPDWLPEDIPIKTDKKGEECIIKCDFCHTDIFHRYYHCEDCDGYDICMYCYSIGRSCQHVNKMSMRQGNRPLTESLDLYKRFVDLVNSVFKEELIVDESSSLSSETPSLATICSRIESYRRAKGNKLNFFTCLHCKKKFTASKLAANGVSLVSIFKRPICSAVSPCAGRPEEVFVCKSCSNKCDSCAPLEETHESMKDYDLCYYTPASFDSRSWGAYFDFNVNKTCDFPDITLVPASSSKKRKADKVEDSSSTRVKRAKRTRLPPDTAPEPAPSSGKRKAGKDEQLSAERVKRPKRVGPLPSASPAVATSSTVSPSTTTTTTTTTLSPSPNKRKLTSEASSSVASTTNKKVKH